MVGLDLEEGDGVIACNLTDDASTYQIETVIPDEIDHGEKPFIRPFMIELASDHFEIDVSVARTRLAGIRSIGSATGCPGWSSG